MITFLSYSIGTSADTNSDLRPFDQGGQAVVSPISWSLPAFERLCSPRSPCAEVTSPDHSTRSVPVERRTMSGSSLL